MPIYSVNHRNWRAKSGYECSPRITLETDLASLEALSVDVQSAADSIRLRTVDAFRNGTVPPGSDGVISWFAGDSLPEGSAAIIRRDLRVPGRRCFVAVHLPCLPELDLFCVEPRWLSAGPLNDYWNLNIRIGSKPSVSPEFLDVLATNDQSWAQILKALLAEERQPGSGMGILDRIRKDKQVSDLIASLAFRNLIVLFIRYNEPEKAQQLLDVALKTYPSYADLTYIGGVLAYRRQDASRALTYLQQAARTINRDFLGSGGETSYRASWLVGTLAARSGQQQVAFDQLLRGAICRPVFRPAVDELLNLRLPPELVKQYQYEFCGIVRQLPDYLDSVFDYLLLHRAFPAAARLAETIPLSQEKKEVLRRKLAAAKAPFDSRIPITSPKTGVMLSGSFFEYSSLSRINREIGLSLMRSPDLDASLEPCAHPAFSTKEVPGGELLARGCLCHPRRLDLTIRHQWPPDFQRPPRGKLAAIFPWEFGAVPRVWIRQIEQNVDELWVPSRFVRDVMIRTGVAARRIQVIPNGIDPALFTPEGPALRPQGCRRFMFLFVGGAIRRKGIDLLLEAYQEAFAPGDEVTLVVSTGSNPSYAHNSLNGLMQQFLANPRTPHLQILNTQLDDATLAALYRACDAFVLPYRGEGFGMPILEAMACGKPVITTAEGASQDFCSPQTTYFVPARQTAVPDPLGPFGELAGEYTWFEPDRDELVRTMRYVREHQAEAVLRGREAARVARENYSWHKVTRMYLDRIQCLVGRSVDEWIYNLNCSNEALMAHGVHPGTGEAPTVSPSLSAGE